MRVCEQEIQKQERQIHDLEQHRRCLQIEIEQKKSYNKQLEQVERIRFHDIWLAIIVGV